MNIAFDVDDTLWKIDYKRGLQVPDYDLVQVLRWFHNNGDKVYVWSAGGMDYARDIVLKLGLSEWVHDILPKPPLYGNDPKIDIAFDDSEITLGGKNILVRRKHHDMDNN